MQSGAIVHAVTCYCDNMIAALERLYDRQLLRRFDPCKYFRVAHGVCESIAFRIEPGQLRPGHDICGLCIEAQLPRNGEGSRRVISRDHPNRDSCLKAAGNRFDNAQTKWVTQADKAQQPQAMQPVMDGPGS